MSPPDTFVKEINAQKVSEPLLGKIMHRHASLPRDDWRDFDRRLKRVLELVNRENEAEGGPMRKWAPRQVLRELLPLPPPSRDRREC